MAQKKIEVITVEIPLDLFDNELINEYKVLNEKCDKVIKKIKDRKAKNGGK